MQIFEYRADVLPHITYSGRQDSKTKPWCNIRRTTEEYILYFLVEGDIFLREDNVDYHLTPGDFFLLEPGKLHFGTQYTNCVFYYVHFLHPAIEGRTITPEALLQECESAHAAWRTSAESGPFPKDTVRIQKHLHVEDKASLSLLADMFEQLLYRQTLRIEHFNLLGAAALCEILIEQERLYVRSLFRSQTRGEQIPARINSVLLYLHTNYKRHLTSAIIEKEVAYSFDYLNQLFKKHLHVSIFKHLENIRIEEAKHILQTRAISIKEIAGEVGYSDEAYFSKVFKRRTGCKPGEYRRGGQKQGF